MLPFSYQSFLIDFQSWFDACCQGPVPYPCAYPIPVDSCCLPGGFVPPLSCKPEVVPVLHLKSLVSSHWMWCTSLENWDIPSKRNHFSRKFHIPSSNHQFSVDMLLLKGDTFLCWANMFALCLKNELTKLALGDHSCCTSGCFHIFNWKVLCIEYLSLPFSHVCPILTQPSPYIFTSKPNRQIIKSKEQHPSTSIFLTHTNPATISLTLCTDSLTKLPGALRWQLQKRCHAEEQCYKCQLLLNQHFLHENCLEWIFFKKHLE